MSAVLLTVGWGATACTGQDAPEGPAPSPTSTPLASYEVRGLEIQRRDPCARVTDTQVRDALGVEPEQTGTWQPGQRLPGTSEVADEWGCSRSAGEITARAWVFSPPVGRAEARRLADDAVGGKCRSMGDERGFGEPGVGYACGLNAGGQVTGFAGLVGDAWVVCELTTGDVDRAGRWCVSVLESLSQA